MVQLRAAGFSYLLPYRRPGPRDAFHYGRTGSPAEVVLGEGGVEDAVPDVARPFGTEARLLFDPCRLRAEPIEVQDACRDPGAHVVDTAAGSRGLHRMSIARLRAGRLTRPPERPSMACAIAR